MFDTAPQLDCNGRTLKLDRPQVMGIVNVTPDSFASGGEHFDANVAVAHGLQLAAEGAAILDIGGESTRPGAEAVSYTHLDVYKRQDLHGSGTAQHGHARRRAPQHRVSRVWPRRGGDVAAQGLSLIHI